jgi:hypothetical protein
MDNACEELGYQLERAARFEDSFMQKFQGSPK